MKVNTARRFDVGVILEYVSFLLLFPVCFIVFSRFDVLLVSLDLY